MNGSVRVGSLEHRSIVSCPRVGSGCRRRACYAVRPRCSAKEDSGLAGLAALETTLQVINGFITRGSAAESRQSQDGNTRERGAIKDHWVSFRAKGSSRTNLEAQDGLVRTLEQYLALPVAEYSLLDPKAITRDPEHENLFCLSFPVGVLEDMFGLKLEPKVWIRVDSNPARSSVTFSSERATLGDPSLDATFRLDMSSTLTAYGQAPTSTMGRLKALLPRAFWRREKDSPKPTLTPPPHDDSASNIPQEPILAMETAQPDSYDSCSRQGGDSLTPQLTSQHYAADSSASQLTRQQNGADASTLPQTKSVGDGRESPPQELSFAAENQAECRDSSRDLGEPILAMRREDGAEALGEPILAMSGVRDAESLAQPNLAMRGMDDAEASGEPILAMQGVDEAECSATAPPSQGQEAVAPTGGGRAAVLAVQSATLGRYAVAYTGSQTLQVAVEAREDSQGLESHMAGDGTSGFAGDLVAYTGSQTLQVAVEAREDTQGGESPLEKGPSGFGGDPASGAASGFTQASDPTGLGPQGNGIQNPVMVELYEGEGVVAVGDRRAASVVGFGVDAEGLAEEDQGLGLGAGVGGQGLSCSVDIAMRFNMPAPFNAVPAPLLGTAGGLILKAILKAALPSFLQLLAKDYMRWASPPTQEAARRDKDGAVGRLLT